jgi:hypothetical protein
MNWPSPYRNCKTPVNDYGLDANLYKAPAVLLFHAEAPGVSNKDDCTIAARTATLLAMAIGLKRVVEAHGGRVTLSSREDKGTEVRLLLMSK